MLVYIQLYVQRYRFANLLKCMLRLNKISGSRTEAGTFGFPYKLHLSLFVFCIALKAI